MQTRNKIFDDISQMMTNAMGVAQGAKTEAETAMKGMLDRWLADRDFVTREEFDAVRAMAQKAREENEALKARLDAMDSKGLSPRLPSAYFERCDPHPPFGGCVRFPGGTSASNAVCRGQCSIDWGLCCFYPQDTEVIPYLSWLPPEKDLPQGRVARTIFGIGR